MKKAKADKPLKFREYHLITPATSKEEIDRLNAQGAKFYKTGAFTMTAEVEREATPEEIKAAKAKEWTQ
jgi:hypothetical protein